jgi:chaperone modulatory protein CbpM
MCFSLTASQDQIVSIVPELSRDLGVNSQGVGVILHLLDQVHSLRSALAGLVETARRKEQT